MGSSIPPSLHLKKHTITIPLKLATKAVKGHNLLDTLDSLCNNDIILGYVVDEERKTLRISINTTKRIDIAMLFQSIIEESTQVVLMNPVIDMKVKE